MGDGMLSLYLVLSGRLFAGGMEWLVRRNLAGGDRHDRGAPGLACCACWLDGAGGTGPVSLTAAATTSSEPAAALRLRCGWVAPPLAAVGLPARRSACDEIIGRGR